MMRAKSVEIAAIRKSVIWIALVAAMLGAATIIILYQAHSSIAEVRSSLDTAEQAIRSATDLATAKRAIAPIVTQQKALLKMLEAVARMGSGALAILFGLLVALYLQVRKAAGQTAEA